MLKDTFSGYFGTLYPLTWKSSPAPFLALYSLQTSPNDIPLYSPFKCSLLMFKELNAFCPFLDFDRDTGPTVPADLTLCSWLDDLARMPKETRNFESDDSGLLSADYYRFWYTFIFETDYRDSGCFKGVYLLSIYLAFETFFGKTDIELWNP
jgi:hypothetical protein